MYLKSVYFFTLAVLLATILTVNSTQDNICKVPIKSKELWRYQWPLVFKLNGDLYPTTKRTAIDELAVNIENGDEVLLSCGPNYLKNFFRKEVLKVQCNGASGNFSYSETSDEKNIKDFACDLRVIEEVVRPVIGCTNEKWTSTNFGYVHPIDQMTYVLGETCYDMSAGKTIFAHIKLGDKDSNYLQKMQKSYLTSHQHPDGRYKIELFRGLHFDEIYEQIRTKLKRRHIPQLKISHFIDEPLISSPQLQPIKKLGWNYFVADEQMEEIFEALKTDISDLAGVTQTQGKGLNLDIYVGSHGINTLHGVNNEKMEVYLHPDRFPMPALIWLVVKHEEKAIAFGVVNNGEGNTNTVEGATTQANEVANLCASDCGKISWLTETMKVSGSTNGRRLICCTYGEFKNKVSEVPHLGSIKELLV